MKTNFLPAAAPGLRTPTAKPASRLIQPKPINPDQPRLKIETATTAPPHAAKPAPKTAN